MKNDKVIYVGEASAEQVEGWKKERDYTGPVQRIEIAIPGTKEVSVGYVRKPNRIHIAKSMGLVIEQKPIEAGEALLDGCWMGGDPRMISIEDEHTDLRVGAAYAMYNHAPLLNAVIKNV